MCGIAGIYNLDGSSLPVEKLKRFTDAMAHRGPDGSGYKLFDNNTLGFGHRRLSILDLSSDGKQPMGFADERYWITYNGEIFNFQEIKSELVLKGFVFKTETDTEVILAAYIAWGKDCLHKFNGMWAFAIWDNEKRELFLSRDRFGIKPLYYLNAGNRFIAFASETRAFKFLEGFSRSFDEQLLSYTMTDPYALEGLGYTPFKGILQLLPGHYMVIRRNQNPEQKRWWNISDHMHQPVPQTIHEQAEKYYDLFRDACRLRLISDVPVATALSGGLDSTSVYSTVYDIIKKEKLARTNPDSQRAFTAIFPGLTENEKEYAERAVAFTGGSIEYVEVPTDNLSSALVRDTELTDFISSSPITSISAVYEGMRKKGIRVSMDGHGVDEMLYGYRDMVYALYSKALWHGSVKDARDYSSVITSMHHASTQPDRKLEFEKQISQKTERESALSFKIKRILIKSPADRSFLPVELSKLSNAAYDFSGLPLAQRMLFHETFEHTLPSLLRNFDRASMMNSVEIRMPFMDWRLVSYVFSLPAANKIGNGYTKLILREAMKNRMDEGLRTRTFKVGIGSPVAHWFKKYLKDWVLDNISDAGLKSKMEKSYKEDSLDNGLVTKAWQEINLKLIS